MTPDTQPTCPDCSQDPCVCKDIDDDLGELDLSKACSLDNPECESCS